ncbi:vacuolar protein sorting-associated protein 16 [Asimina triloba]
MGVGFGSHIQRDRFQEMCKTLRVLNAVRNHEIGIPLSIQQYKLLTAPVLIARLINAHHHLLALQISEYLGLNKEVVVMHWACAKITSSLSIPDSTLLEVLLDKLKLCKGISYAAVAAHADSCGRRKLAAMLVEYEPHSSKQVPLLLSIGEENTALAKATESGDTDLVYLVMFHIWQKVLLFEDAECSLVYGRFNKPPPLEFFGIIQSGPLSRNLFITYARLISAVDQPSVNKLQLDQTCLCRYVGRFGGIPEGGGDGGWVRGWVVVLLLVFPAMELQYDNLQEVAFLLWKESWEMRKNPMASKGSPLHGPRIKLIEKAQLLFSDTKDHIFEAKAAEEHAKLLRVQHDLEVSTKQAVFVDSNISDTIRTCLQMGNHRAAMKVRAEFKVSEKRWYWIKVFALAAKGDWDALEKFSKEKKPPIGTHARFRPFVEVCIDANEKAEALKYIPKLADPRERAESYARIGMAKEAADAASQAKDGELLGRLKLTFAQNSAATSIFDTLRDRLSFQGVS